MLTRMVPHTRVSLPAVGLGTWATFDVGTAPAERAPLVDVLRAFHGAGGTVIDSSPMYGRAETVVGDLVEEAGLPGQFFLCTKVWTRGAAEGRAQMAQSMARMRTRTMDLMQVHNLLDWQVHLPRLQQMKAEGTVRHVGITHHALGALPEMEQMVRAEAVDFVQLPLSMATRASERRLIPAAVERGVAVLVMRPFDEGALFDQVKGKAVPEWATRELGCRSWAAFFLKWILGNPGVTCAIPATRKVAHLQQNMSAMDGRLPTADERARMLKDVGL